MKDPHPSTSAARVPGWVGALDGRHAVLRAALDGDSLHWGLWTAERPGLPVEAAQERLLEQLAGWLPEPPATVALSGWGLGSSATWLAARGHRVVAVGGTPEQCRYARHRHGGERILFVEADSGLNPPADLDGVGGLLMLDPREAGAELAEWAAQILPVGGRLVIATLVDRAGEGTSGCHTEAELATAFAEHGFVVLERSSVDREVAPTIERLLGRLESRRRQIAALLGPDGGPTVDEVITWWRSRSEAFGAGREGYTLWVCRRDELCIRGYQEGDEHRILPLFEGVFYNRRSLEHWAWKYRDNPFGARRIAVAVADDGELAAHFAAYPVRLRSTVPGVPDCESMQVGDTMTHPAYRRKGLGPTGLLSRVAHYYYDRFCRGRVPFLYGFNTGSIRKLGERYLGYEYLPEIQVATAAAGALRRPWRRRAADRLRGWVVTRVRQVGADHDRLLEKVAPSYGMLVRRDAAWLRWRYLGCPDAVHRLVEVRRRGELVGWSAFRREGATLRWGDALFRTDHPEAVAVLLDGALRLEGAGVERVSGWLAPHPEWWVARLHSLGFVSEPEPNGLAPGFKIFDPAYGTTNLGPHLYFTEGDSDLF